MEHSKNVHKHHMEMRQLAFFFQDMKTSINHVITHLLVTLMTAKEIKQQIPFIRFIFEDEIVHFFLARPTLKGENVVNVNELLNISEFRVNIYHHKSRQKVRAEMLKISR